MPPNAKSDSMSATFCGKGMSRVPVTRTAACHAITRRTGRTIGSTNRRSVDRFN